MKTVIICLLLTGCANMQNLPVCPEITLKLCPAVTQ